MLTLRSLRLAVADALAGGAGPRRASSSPKAHSTGKPEKRIRDRTLCLPTTLYRIVRAVLAGCIRRSYGSASARQPRPTGGAGLDTVPEVTARILPDGVLGTVA